MAKADGDQRPIGQIRTELFSLLLRRRRPARPARGGRANLTITATLEAPWTGARRRRGR